MSWTLVDMPSHTIRPSHQRSYELFVLNDSSRNNAKPCTTRTTYHMLYWIVVPDPVKEDIIRGEFWENNWSSYSPASWYQILDFASCRRTKLSGLHCYGQNTFWISKRRVDWHLNMHLWSGFDDICCSWMRSHWTELLWPKKDFGGSCTLHAIPWGLM